VGAQGDDTVSLELSGLELGLIGPGAEDCVRAIVLERPEDWELPDGDRRARFTSLYDLTGCAWSAAQLAGCDPKTVRRYIAIRAEGSNPHHGLAAEDDRSVPGED
jgi:hypothetical protein